MASLGLPVPEVAALVAIGVECVGGLPVLVGYQTRLVGLVMAGWCIATALVAHAHFGDQNQTVHFLKNLAMSGESSSSGRLRRRSRGASMRGRPASALISKAVECSHSAASTTIIHLGDPAALDSIPGDGRGAWFTRRRCRRTILK